MQMKLSSRDAMIAAIAAIVVVAGLFVAFVIVPRFGVIKRLDADLAQADQQIAEAQRVLARRQDAKAASAQTQAELLALANRMPDSPEMPTLIIELQDTANEAGVEFVKLAPYDPTADTGFSRVKMDMQIVGQWSDMIEYLRRLAKLDRQVRIVAVKIKPVTSMGGSKAAESTELQADIVLEAYTLASASSSATPPPSPAPVVAQ